MRHRHPQDLRGDRTLGQRAADATSDFVGSWRFIFLYIALTLAWCGANALAFVKHWDPYPFIFYTFSVSVLAILLSSLILLAGNRQAEIDRAHAENAYHHVDEVNDKQDRQLTILARQNDASARQHREMLKAIAQIIRRLDALAPPQRDDQ